MDCEWTLDEGCLGPSWTALDPALKARATSLAVDTLRRLTAYRVGGCPITVRPTRAGCCFIPSNGFEPTGSFAPGVNVAGQWVNNCGCHQRLSQNEVSLPPPVGRVDAVRIDGFPVSVGNYRVDDGHILVWTGPGLAPWNLSQDVNLSDTQAGTFSVTYLKAHPVGSAGRYAAAVLANEFAKACSGQKCRLPPGVTTVARQGITMEIASGAFPGGLTGIREVDAFVALWNPRGADQPSRVWSPDLYSARRVGR